MKNTPSLSSLLFAALFLLFFLLFLSLGIWQIQRLHWKETLISHIQERIHLPPKSVPIQSEWSHITAECCEYQPVFITGHYLHDKEILVHALTKLGTGYWLLTPFQQNNGAIHFINRGFIPMDQKQASHRSSSQIHGETTLYGLLRMSETNSFYPRKNHPDKEQWYTRELAAMARLKNLDPVAPYFIDLNHDPNQKDGPIGGLTVVEMPNHHLIYAITWFFLASGVALAAFFVFRPIKK